MTQHARITVFQCVLLARTAVEWNEDRRHGLGEGEEWASRPEEGIPVVCVCVCVCVCVW